MKHYLLAGLAVGIILGTLLIGFFSKPKMDSPETTLRYKQAYVDSCSQSGNSSKMFCECVFDVLSKDNSVARITDMGLQARETNRLPSPMKNAIKKCAPLK